MEIPMEDMLSWDDREGEIVEPTGPSERQVCISEPVMKPGTQSNLVIGKGRGHGRGYGGYKK